MRVKGGVSPWHTKDISYDQDQQDIISKYEVKQKLKKLEKIEVHSPENARKGKQCLEDSLAGTIQRSQSTREPLSENIKQNDNPNGSFKKRVIKSSHKNQRQADDAKDARQRVDFDNQTWKLLTISTRDRFRNEYAQLKKYQNLAVEIKTRRSSRNTFQHDCNLFNQQIQQKQPPKPILQQLSIKNFIIHGHYTDKQPQHFNRRKQNNSYIMKQKFATLKKTINLNENGKENQTYTNSARNVIMKGNREKENLFKVIKLERQINNKIL